MSEIKRVLVPIDSHDPESFKVALGYADKICELGAPDVRDVVLLTHTKHQLDHTSLSRFMGPTMTKALAKKGSLGLPSGAMLRSETMATLRFLSKQSVIVVFYAERKILDFVDGLRNVSGVVVVPYLPDDAQEWVARWAPIVHGQPNQPPAVLIDDPVVARALESLTRIINLSNGVLHPRDKEHANETLRILRAKGHKDVSRTIKSWAIKNGWQVSAATELEALSKKIWALRTKPGLAGFYNPQARYERWRDGT